MDTLSQDWFLTNSEEENGFTLLEFSRNFTSCDPQDLDITVCEVELHYKESQSIIYPDFYSSCDLELQHE